MLIGALLINFEFRNCFTNSSRPIYKGSWQSLRRFPRPEITCFDSVHVVIKPLWCTDLVQPDLSHVAGNPLQMLQPSVTSDYVVCTILNIAEIRVLRSVHSVDSYSCYFNF